MSTSIRSIHARRVWDSRGRPTVEAEVTLRDGALGRAIVPAGASKGTREALELRDGSARFGGLDVLRAVANVNGEIACALVGTAADDQAAVDVRLIALDGTEGRTRLGANATLAVSMAAAHAAAASRRLPLYESIGGPDATLLPMPQIQIFGGGAHAGRRVDIQDFMVMCTGATSFAQALANPVCIWVMRGCICLSNTRARQPVLRHPSLQSLVHRPSAPGLQPALPRFLISAAI